MSRGSTRLGRFAVIAIIVAALVAGSIWGYRRLTAGRTAVRYITRPVAYTDISVSVASAVVSVSI